jgi:hypothetical protein
VFSCNGRSGHNGRRLALCWTGCIITYVCVCVCVCAGVCVCACVYVIVPHIVCVYLCSCFPSGHSNTEIQTHISHAFTFGACGILMDV